MVFPLMFEIVASQETLRGTGANLSAGQLVRRNTGHLVSRQNLVRVENAAIPLVPRIEKRAGLR
jgi:hypothetical protein